MSFLSNKISKKSKSYRRSFFVLFFLLFAIIFLQQELSKPKFSKGMAALFNLPKQSVVKNNNLKKYLKLSFKKKHLAWCSTRVVRLDMGSVSLVNRNFKWYRNGKVMDSLFMERWLARYCKLPVIFIKKPFLSEGNKQALFCVHFINNQKQCFYKTRGPAFEWRSKQFLSSRLKEAVNQILFLTNKR